MIAAAYARFSSDSQREESIEIQLREITRLIESRGWTRGEVYTDMAISGTREDRPAFNRCLADAEAGMFGALVVYKLDRFARNVKFAQESRRRLAAAGVQLVSVREGDQRDTPEGFLFGTLNDAWAEYYSRNLSVMVRGGIRQSARQLKAAGRRMYGYRTGADGRYEIDEREAADVRWMYGAYLDGMSMNEIAADLNRRGRRTARGSEWSLNTVGYVLKNRAYYGLYEYCGVVAEGAIPAIIDRETYDRAERRRERRKNSKRRKVVNDYLLTEKTYCLRCGMPMCGTAGTSRTGKKYTYYGCVHKGGCGLRVSSATVERTVLGVLTESLSDPGTIEAICRDLVEYGNSIPDEMDALESEAAEVRRRRDNLVNALLEGVPAESVREALQGCEKRLEELRVEMSRARAEREAITSPERAREFLARFMDGVAEDPVYAKLLVDTFIDRIYVDKEDVVICFALGDEPDGFDLDEMKAIKYGSHPNKPVRTYPLCPPETARTEKTNPPRTCEDTERVRTDDVWSG